MTFFSRIGSAVKWFFQSLFGADGAKVLAVVEENAALVKAAKPVIADLAELVPDTRVAVEVARTQVARLLEGHWSGADVVVFFEENAGLDVKRLLAAAAFRMIRLLPAAAGFTDSQINLAIEVALQVLRK